MINGRELRVSRSRKTDSRLILESSQLMASISVFDLLPHTLFVLPFFPSLFRSFSSSLLLSSTTKLLSLPHTHLYKHAHTPPSHNFFFPSRFLFFVSHSSYFCHMPVYALLL